MQDFLTFINGKKTYITGLAIILTAIGTKYGVIPGDSFWYVVTILAGVIAIFMRAGVSKLAPDMKIDIPEPVAPDPTQPIPDLKQAMAQALKEIIAEEQTSGNMTQKDTNA